MSVILRSGHLPRVSISQKQVSKNSDRENIVTRTRICGVFELTWWTITRRADVPNGRNLIRLARPFAKAKIDQEYVIIGWRRHHVIVLDISMQDADAVHVS
jgi:hypothetical protein